MTDHKQDIDELLKVRYVPLPSVDLEQRILDEAYRFEHNDRKRSAGVLALRRFYAELCEGLLLPRPALTLFIIMVFSGLGAGLTSFEDDAFSDADIEFVSVIDFEGFE